jgi:hypothetical protein
MKESGGVTVKILWGFQVRSQNTCDTSIIAIAAASLPHPIIAINWMPAGRTNKYASGVSTTNDESWCAYLCG